MPIHWFPGHMATARKEIRRAMPEVDLVIEVLDARLPFSSENPLVAELRGETPSLKILNKRDLADPAVTEEWLAALSARPGVRAMAHDQKQGGLLKLVTSMARSMVAPIRVRPMMAMILGIPNVGKSTIINTLAGRSIAKTGNKPAVTQTQQRVPVGTDLVLLDTPGFLWPKLSPELCAMHLAVSGAISDRVLDPVELAAYLVNRYPSNIAHFYGVAATVPQEGLLEAVGRRRGFLVKGGGVDLVKAAERLLFDFRGGALGRISLERPGEFA